MGKTGSFFERHAGTASAESLAWLRMVASGILLANVLWEDLPSSARMPHELFEPPGLMQLLTWLPGFDSFLGDPVALGALQAATGFLLALTFLGAGTRITMPLAALAYYVMGGVLRGYSHFFHPGLVPMGILVILSFAPAADAWSADRLLYRLLRRPRRWSRVDPALRMRVYGLARWACWLLIALAYASAGASKLRDGGWMWWDPVNLQRILYASTLHPTETFDFTLSLALVDIPPFALAAMGLGTLAVELGFIATLFSARARRLLPFAAMGMHLGICLLQNILFFDLVLLPLFFLDPARLRRTAARRTSRDAPLAPVTKATRVVDSILARAYRRRLRTLCTVLLAVQIPVGLIGIELYPLTAWQMFSARETTGQVEYHRMLARDASGQQRRLHLRDCIPAMADSRYQDFVWRSSYGGRDELLMDEIADACADAWNRTAAPDTRIVEIEIQRWAWNFLDEPHDPEPGQLMHRYLRDVEARRTRHLIGVPAPAPDLLAAQR